MIVAAFVVAKWKVILLNFIFLSLPRVSDKTIQIEDDQLDQDQEHIVNQVEEPFIGIKSLYHFLKELSYIFYSIFIVLKNSF